jgi:hypothetical protein
MFARNVSVHLKSNMLSDDTRTFKKDILPSLRKQNGIRKLIVGGMMLGLLTGVCFAQRAASSARPAPNANTVAPNASPVPSASPAIPSASPVPSASPATPSPNSVTPSANPVTPNVNTADPNANTVDPNMNTVAPGTNTVGPTDMTQKPPIPPNTVVSPDAAPPSPQH